MLSLLSEKILRLVFPRRCGHCQTHISGDSSAFLCPACARLTEWIRSPFCPSCGRNVPLEGLRCQKCRHDTAQEAHFDRAFACVMYEGPIKSLMHEFKFGCREDLHRYFASHLCAFTRQHLINQGINSVIAVPLDRNKRLQRGFNQTALLARMVSRELGCEDLSPCLKRLFAPQDQARLAKSARRVNVKNAFALDNNFHLAGKKILLIDDILTTGQTASECARVLKRDGHVQSVWVLAVARGA